MRFLKQTDIVEEKNIFKAGCLFMCLLYIVQKFIGKTFTKEEILFIYKHLVKQKTMKKNCFVKDHEAVGNEGFSFMIAPDVRLKYIGAHYIDKSIGADWGRHHGDFIIVHVRTIRGNGHFRLFDYDPYSPSPGYDKIKSLRYYDIEEGKDEEI